MAEATPGQKAYTLAVFFCINLLNYSDRQVPRNLLDRDRLRLCISRGSAAELL
jgi:hypothetical protein